MSSTAADTGASSKRTFTLVAGEALGRRFHELFERVSRRAPELALVAFGIALRVKALTSYSYTLGYDFGDHSANVKWWSEHFQMPPLDLGRGSYHPQLYYVLGGLLLRLTQDLWSVQVLSAFFGSVRLLLMWWAAERYLNDRIARLAVLALSAAMPVALAMDAMVTQEAMNNLLALGFLIAVLELVRAPDARRLPLALGVGVLAGLGLLLKMSNFVLLGLIGAAALLELVQRRELSVKKQLLRLATWALPVVVAGALSAPQYVYNHNAYGKAVMDGWYKRPTADTTAVAAHKKEVLDRRTLGFVFGFTPNVLTYPYYPLGSYPESRFWSILLASTYADHYNFNFAPSVDGGGKVPAIMNPWRTSAGGTATKWARGSIAAGIGIALIVMVGWLWALPRLLLRREVARPTALLMPALGLAGALYFAIKYPYDFEGVVKGHYLHFVSPPLYAVYGSAVSWLLRRRVFAPLGWLGAALSIPPAVYCCLCVFR